MRFALCVGIGAWAFSWGALLAKASDAHPLVPGGVFAATVTGDVRALPRGEAAFGDAVAEDAGPFTITLGANGKEGAVVLTRLDGARPGPGVYRITEVVQSPDSSGFRALYVAGPADRPTGAYRARTGTLEVFSASDEMVEGRFRFLADDEGREVAVTGWFTAQAD